MTIIEKEEPLIDWVERVMTEQRKLNPELFATLEQIKIAQKGIDLYTECFKMIKGQNLIIDLPNKTY